MLNKILYFLVCFCPAAIVIADFPPPSVWCPSLPTAVAKTYPACSALVPAKDGERICEFASCEAEDTLSNEIFEGDIMGIDHGGDIEKDPQHNAITAEKRRWPGGIVPYRIASTSYGDDAEAITALIETAMQTFHRRTCVRFQQRASADSDYLVFGPPRGPKEDDYVEINFSNIRGSSGQGVMGQFKAYTDGEVTNFGLPYDFGSVMHYPWNAFAIDPNVWTIRPKPNYSSENKYMGQRIGMSELDIKKINALYKCTKPGPCSKKPGWFKIEGKCYYLSFLGNDSELNYFRARNLCQTQYKAFIASIPTSAVRSRIQELMMENSSKFKGARKVWLTDFKTLMSTSDEQREEYRRTWHFICSKAFSSIQEKSYIQTNEEA